MATSSTWRARAWSIATTGALRYSSGWRLAPIPASPPATLEAPLLCEGGGGGGRCVGETAALDPPAVAAWPRTTAKLAALRCGGSPNTAAPARVRRARRSALCGSPTRTPTATGTADSPEKARYASPASALAVGATQSSGQLGGAPLRAPLAPPPRDGRSSATPSRRCVSCRHIDLASQASTAKCEKPSVAATPTSTAGGPGAKASAATCVKSAGTRATASVAPLCTSNSAMAAAARSPPWKAWTSSPPAPITTATATASSCGWNAHAAPLHSARSAALPATCSVPRGATRSTPAAVAAADAAASGSARIARRGPRSRRGGRRE